ncbi:unnamed protein product [Clonostachys rhizophaga]|uniref:Uncharacterized protein n=1 Tax=Clonostachys rhizophaga TaxID=160324 RepID=A0A9N9W0I3_9HYPO|nr:unnamed protein product [Clonostachys rhizophaga]
MPTELKQAELRHGGLVLWYFTESLECCRKHMKQAEAVMPPQRNDQIELSNMQDEITFLAQSMAKAKSEAELNALAQVMQKVCVEQAHLQTEQEATLARRQVGFLNAQEEIVERYIREREAIDSKLSALMCNKEYVAGLMCVGSGKPGAAGQGVWGDHDAGLPARETGRKRLMPVGDGANEPKRQCSQHEMSFFHDDSDSSQEEDKEEGVPVSRNPENTLRF